jgi:hypothetical protein
LDEVAVFTALSHVTGAALATISPEWISCCFCSAVRVSGRAPEPGVDEDRRFLVVLDF